MDSAVELQLRQLIFERLADIVAENGVITQARARNSSDRRPTTTDHRSQSRHLEPEGSPRHACRWSPTQGSVRRYTRGRLLFSPMTTGRAAPMAITERCGVPCELGLPIILLHTIRPGIFVPIFPGLTTQPTADSSSPSTKAFASSPIRFNSNQRTRIRRANRETTPTSAGIPWPHPPRLPDTVHCVRSSARKAARCRTHHCPITRPGQVRRRDHQSFVYGWLASM